ncbi:MAG: hypothetical protein DRJ38_00450 [Thermoprotei archaeon]|nr:MAG: hypothetical protein DRJ38_00450 [Thermoprotei archaeon]
MSLRKQILKYLETAGGATNYEIAEALGVDATHVSKVIHEMGDAVKRFDVTFRSRRLRQTKWFGTRKGTRYFYYVDRKRFVEWLARRIRVRNLRSVSTFLRHRGFTREERKLIMRLLRARRR